MGNQQGACALNDRTVSAQRPGEGTVYALKKYRETGGTSDYDKLPTVTLSQYEIVGAGNAPPAFKRIYQDSGETALPKIDNDGGEESTAADGSKTFTFSAGSVSGYKKSTCATTGIPDCGSGSARFVIKPNGANSILIYAYKAENGYASSQYWSGYAGYAEISYQVSTEPTGGGSSGSVTVHPVTKYNIAAIKPATVTQSTVDGVTRTFLVQQSTAVQNFAFDGMDDLEIEMEV